MLCAEGTREYCAIGVSTREVQFYSIKQMELIKTVHTLQPPTTMCLLQERILVYGIGDEGYGCIFIKEDFRLIEQNSGKEKNKRSIAKTAMMANLGQDGFIWKVGGYTAITGNGFTKKSQSKKKTSCFISLLK